MKKPLNIVFYLFIILLLLALGYYRDFVFRSINAMLQAWDSEVDYYMPPSLRFFENFEYDTVVKLKWILTLVFTIAYLAVALLAVKYIFRRVKFIKITIFVYIGLIALSAILVLIGAISGNGENMYEFARYFMGMAQSPLILMILFPVFKLTEKENAAGQQ